MTPDHRAADHASSRLLAGQARLCEGYDLALLDLDGVVYIGPDAVPGAAAALIEVRRAGVRVSFVTNNASRPPGVVSEHLTDLGVPASQDEVMTSAQVAAASLARKLPEGSAVLVIGGEGLRVALTEVGLEPVCRMIDSPVAVVQGFSRDIDWELLAEGTRAVRAGLHWTATNLDLTVPTPFGPAPGNGTLVQVIASAAGRGPDDVAGKPQPAAFLEAARRYASVRPLVVGDRLDTDIEGGRAAGMHSLLVLTGVSGAKDLLSCPPERRPDYIDLDLAGLLRPQPAAGATWTADAVVGKCGAEKVMIRNGTMESCGEGTDPVAVLRACCVAAWAIQDAGESFDGAALGDAITTLEAISNGAAWAR